MSKKKPARPRSAARKVSEAKVAMSYRLSPARIARARKLLGTTSATATIEEALDLVVFRDELIDGVTHAFGVPIAERFPDSRSKRRR